MIKVFDQLIDLIEGVDVADSFQAGRDISKHFFRSFFSFFLSLISESHLLRIHDPSLIEGFAVHVSQLFILINKGPLCGVSDFI